MGRQNRVVLCLPTGAGKSVIFSEMVRLTATRGKRVLVLTHRLELFDATFRHLEGKGITPDIISQGKENPHPWSMVVVAMVETLTRRMHRGYELEPQLIIIDEAHFGNFNKIIDLFPAAYIIGVTATPVGKHFHKYYSEIVNNIDIPELIEKGFLSPCRPYEMVRHDFSDVKTDSHGEYESESLFNHYNKRSLYDGVVEGYKEKCQDRQTIVFNVNISHTEEMTRSFNDAGIRSECVTSDTNPHERKQILAAFKEGRFPVLNNCGILTTGYDEPSISAVIMNRATKSLPLWLQCQGRGSRIHPGKKDFIVLDYGENHRQHGLWNSERMWTLSPPKKKKEMKDAAPVKNCPQCSAMLAPAVRVCEFCGYEFPVDSKELAEGVLVEVSDPILDLRKRWIGSLSVAELTRVHVAKRYKGRGFVVNVIKHLYGDDGIKEFAERMGYSDKYVIVAKKIPLPPNFQINKYTFI